MQKGKYVRYQASTKAGLYPTKIRSVLHGIRSSSFGASLCASSTVLYTISSSLSSALVIDPRWTGSLNSGDFERAILSHNAARVCMSLRRKCVSRECDQDAAEITFDIAPSVYQSAASHDQIQGLRHPNRAPSALLPDFVFGP